MRESGFPKEEPTHVCKDSRPTIDIVADKKSEEQMLQSCVWFFAVQCWRHKTKDIVPKHTTRFISPADDLANSLGKSPHKCCARQSWATAIPPQNHQDVSQRPPNLKTTLHENLSVSCASWEQRVQDFCKRESLFGNPLWHQRVLAVCATNREKFERATCKLPCLHSPWMNGSHHR